MTTPAGHSFACKDGNHEACAMWWCDCACHPAPSWVKAGEGTTASAPVSTTLTIGGVSIRAGEVSYLRAEPPPAVVSGPLSFKFDVAFEASEVAALRALFSPTPSPLSTVTITSRDRRGNLRTETLEGVTVVFARGGRKRPGQWTDRTRTKRARRLERAAERRAGISRRGLRHGFPIPPYRSLAAIHEETRRALVETDDEKRGARTAETLTDADIEAGKACQKGFPGCYCRVGWPYDKMCRDCRDEPDRDRGSYCVCGPVEKEGGGDGNH